MSEQWLHKRNKKKKKRDRSGDWTDNWCQKAWRTVAQDHFKKVPRKSGSVEAKCEEMKGDSRFLPRTVHKVTLIRSWAVIPYILSGQVGVFEANVGGLRPPPPPPRRARVVL